MKLADCFGKGLLRETRAEPGLAKKDLAQASFFLREADELLSLQKRVMASIALYNAFFHAARALLFNDGVKERSHYCIARYLEERYVTTRRVESHFLDAFETVMSIRHNAQYGTDELVIEEDLAELSTLCRSFIDVVEGLL